MNALVKSSNRRVLLARRPSGVPQPHDFAFDEARMAPLAHGEFRVRNHFLSIDPAQPGWATSSDCKKPTDAMTLFYTDLAHKQIEVKRISTMGRNAVHSNATFIDDYFGRIAPITEQLILSFIAEKVLDQRNSY